MLLTITGIDDPDTVDQLPAGVEYGVLWTMSDKQGTGRYPAANHIQWIIQRLRRRKDVGIALHVCGSEARRLIKNPKVKRDRQYIDEVGFLDLIDRIQVNGTLSIDEARLICVLYPNHQIIFQMNENNRDLVKVKYYHENVSFLIDESGGRGKTPNSWDTIIKLVNLSGKRGFAGGLGPDNLNDQLQKIKSVIFDHDIGFSNAWIDMESNVRDNDDALSIDKVKEVFDIFCRGTIGGSSWSYDLLKKVVSGRVHLNNISYEDKLSALRYIEYTKYVQEMFRHLGVK